MSKRRKVPKTGDYFHYTSADAGHLGSILDEGILRTSESNLSLTVEHLGPDVVWLIDGPLHNGEQHGLVTPMTGDLKSHVEIVVRLPKAEVSMWAGWALEHGISNSELVALVRSGGGVDNAVRWRVIERPVPRAEWMSITYKPLGLSIPVTATEVPEQVQDDMLDRWAKVLSS